MQTLSDLDLNRPWTDREKGAEGDRPQWWRPTGETLARAASALSVIGATVFVIAQLRPGLILGPSTDVGGDSAAHIASASYLIHHLLPRGQISGWDPQWFGGFPLYVFYFPLPAVIIAILSPIFHYAVAFKLVTVLGTVLLPAAGYLFGRLAGFARPIPALMSIATLAFIFNVSYTIDGGNLASTLAGEFSFTLSLTFALVFLGVFARSLDTGRLRWLAAILYPCALLSHVVPALFAAAGAVALWAAARDRHAGLRILLTVGVTGGLLSSFWLLRFAADLRYASSMGYTRVGGVFGNLFPQSAELAIQILAALGFALALWQRHRVALVLGALALGSAGAFWLFPSGMVYNGRWLPFWFLTTALLAAYAVGELGRLALAAPVFGRANEWATPLATGLVTVSLIAGYLGVLPLVTTPVASRSFLPGWVSWNYTGYEGKSGWNQYQSVIAMLLGAARVHGCGRLDYEYSANMNNAFGSTLVPMAFPYWTGGCIGSEEGLYYESSSSTPFHFLDQAELSIAPSNPVVGLPYQGLDVSDGIRHLQLTGVKYFLANSTAVESDADADPELVRVGSVAASADVVENEPNSTPSANPRWVLYLIKNSPLVTPLTHQPIVEAGMSKDSWLKTAIAWYQTPADWSIPLVTTGPANWRREPPGTLLGAYSGVGVPRTSVSGVVTTDSTISFNVTRTGVPVDVKIPYFPNWEAQGATGPYLESPNMMVVVPTAHHVVLRYGTTTVDWLGRLGTAIGLGGVMLLRTPVAPANPAPTPPLTGETGEPEADVAELDETEGTGPSPARVDAPPGW